MSVLINASASAGLQITPDNSTAIQFQDNGANTVIIDASGNVGIGTTSPQARFDAKVSAANTKIATFAADLGTNNNRGVTLYSPATDSASDPFYFDTGNSYAWHTDGVERFRIGVSGQIGLSGANYGTSGQVLTSAGASAAPTWSNVGMTLLGTINTTSNNAQSLSGLTLTNYKQLVMVFDNVSANASVSFLVGTSTADDVIVTTATGSQSGAIFGMLTIDLNSGVSVSNTIPLTSNSTNNMDNGTITYTGDLPITTAATTVSVACSVASAVFDLGSVRVYGV